MTRSTHPTSRKNTKRSLKTLKLACRDSGDGLEPPSKRSRLNFSLSNPPVFDLPKDDIIVGSSSQGSASSRFAEPATSQTQRHAAADIKGKCREATTTISGEEDYLWVDKYEPTSETELAVHKRKVDDVRRWLLEAFEGGPSAKLHKYHRILALTGPAGTAKTSTLRVLSRELDFEILEWRNGMNERGPSAFTDGEFRMGEGLDVDTETLFDKFQSFLTRAMTCSSVFGQWHAAHSVPLGPSPSQIQSSSTQRSHKRQLVLLEDLPNLLHLPTQARFQAALRSLCIPNTNTSKPPAPPIVIIISDSGLRAEQPDDDTWDGGSNGRRWDRKEALDIRSILGPDLLTSPYVTRIGFNPIAPTLMTKALQALLASHFGSPEARERAYRQPSHEVVDIVVRSSNGDIRSAIMALQFACVVDLPASSATSKGKGALKTAGRTKRTAVTNVRAVLEAVTRREQSLVLFHLMGKILYNKRKFDPPAPHLSVKDAAKERESDMQLVDLPPLPVWLSHHDRRPSRVCTETLVAESPIDSSLLGLYTHQNYTQFCTDVDQCDGVCEGLSWVDCMGGALTAHSPYAFPALALSTLHALPTPVPRHGQKVCKPTWFDVRAKELEALDAVGDVLGWLGRGVDAVASGTLQDEEEPPSSLVGRWTCVSVATELGSWLRAVDRCGGGGGSRSPQTHRLFSHLPWSFGVAGGECVLGENEDGLEVERSVDGEEDVRLPGSGTQGGEETKWWLEDDDIEDVE